MPTACKTVWLTFGNRELVETPALWRMSRAFPDVSFNIHKASVTPDIGIVAVTFEGAPERVDAALEHLRQAGVTVEPADGRQGI